MKPLKQFFKTVTWKQFVVVFLAGIFMLVTTACSRTKAATPPNQYNPDTPGQAMYPHKDTVRDTTAADAKADRLIRQAEERRQKIKGPGDYLEEVEPGKSVERAAKDMGQSTQRAADNAAKSTQRAAEDAVKSTQRTAENVGKSTQRAAEDAVESTQKGLKNLRENASEAADQAGRAVDRATTPNFPNS